MDMYLLTLSSADMFKLNRLTHNIFGKAFVIQNVRIVFSHNNRCAGGNNLVFNTGYQTLLQVSF